MIQSEFLAEAKARLAEAFGERFKGLVLHGSEARGDAGPDSDIDLLVLLDGPIKLWGDISQIVHALYPMQLDMERPIQSMPVDAEDFDAGRIALYRRAKAEGVRA